MAFPKAIDKSKDNSVRRVVKQGLFYICGMCGARYGNEAQAEACLKGCIKRYMDQSAVQDKPEKTGTVYRCTYCKRVYEKMIQAKECARTCKDDIQKKIDAESRFKKTQTVEDKRQKLAAFAGGDQNIPSIKAAPARAEVPAPARTAARKSPPAEAPAKPGPSAKRGSDSDLPPMESRIDEPSKPVHPAEGTKFEREGKSYKCHNCHQKYQKYQEAIACYDRHREQEKAGVATKKEGEDKFFRDGAKYVCKKCNTKWFSRGEVITCFDGHKPEADVWVTGPQDAPAKAEAPASGGKESLDQLRARRATARSEGEKFFRDGAKYVCRICNKKLFTKSEVIQCYDAHAAEEEGADSGPTLTTQDIETAAAEKGPPSVKTGNNRDGEDKFYRDGPKYVCKKCNVKYFTRNEVIQCFDKH